MTVLTAADYADTGQWRMIVKIHPAGMSAHLENTIHDDVEPQELFTASWDADPDNLLRNIENTVYDHPRVLDDFSAKIILFDRKTVFMPTELLVETEGAEDTFYTSLYPAEEADVMCQTDKDITAAFHLAPGLKGFLSRTFPGARIGCNLMGIVASNRHQGKGYRLVLSVRECEADFVLLRDSDLLSASTHSWTSEADIVYHAFNLLDVYGIAPKDTAIICDGTPIPEAATDIFRKFCRPVSNDKLKDENN